VSEKDYGRSRMLVRRGAEVEEAKGAFEFILHNEGEKFIIRARSKQPLMYHDF
jgi:hypothetical protein